MKSQYVSILVVSLAVYGCTRSPSSTQSTALPGPNDAREAAKSQDDILPAGAIQFSNVDLQQVLPIYQELIVGTVDIPESVKRVHSLISLTNNETMSRTQVVRLFENALHEQANVVATHTGSNHIVLNLNKSR